MAVMTLLKVWMRRATPEQQKALADKAGTTRATLYQVSNADRGVSPGRAHRIADATAELAKGDPDLPRLYATDLSSDCSACQYARKCLGSLATRGEFEYLDPEDTEGGSHD